MARIYAVAAQLVMVSSTGSPIIVTYSAVVISCFSGDVGGVRGSCKAVDLCPAKVNNFVCWKVLFVILF